MVVFTVQSGYPGYQGTLVGYQGNHYHFEGQVNRRSNRRYMIYASALQHASSLCTCSNKQPSFMSFSDNRKVECMLVPLSAAAQIIQ